MTEPPNTERCPVCEGLDQPGLLHNPKALYCSQVEPPNTEALRSGVEWMQRALKAEAELGRVRESAARLVDENIIESGRADVAEAELRRVRAERDELWKVNQTLASDHYFARAEKSDARLDRAAAALREIENWPHGHTRRIARAALAEIEESG